ncbi:MAG: DnaA N-terminal domain-containing protein, partial [Spirochaetota bacterium]
MATGETGYGIFWTEAMNQLEEELSEQEFAMWFNRMVYVRSDDTRIVVAVPSSFYRDQVKQRYLPVIEEKLYELSGNKLVIEFEIKQFTESSPATTETGATPARARSQRPKKETDDPADTPFAPAKRKPKRPHDTLKREYTFDTFVIGQNNSMVAINGAIEV